MPEVLLGAEITKMKNHSTTTQGVYNPREMNAWAHNSNTVWFLLGHSRSSQGCFLFQVIENMTQADLLNKGNVSVIVTWKYSSKAHFKRSDPIAHKVVKKSVCFFLWFCHAACLGMSCTLRLTALMAPGWLPMAPGQLVFLQPERGPENGP